MISVSLNMGLVKGRDARESAILENIVAISM